MHQLGNYESAPSGAQKLFFLGLAGLKSDYSLGTLEEHINVRPSRSSNIHKVVNGDCTVIIFLPYL